MKIILAISALLALSACGHHPATLPPPPVVTKVVTQNVGVPVLCRVEIHKAQVAIDALEQGQKLEQQNAALRQSIAQQRAYVTALEAGIIGCGGKISQ